MKLPVMFVVSTTYQKSTEEDIEAGEIGESGFELESEKMTMDELEEHMTSTGYVHPSSVPNITARDYITTDNIEDSEYFEKGINKTYSIHLNNILDADGNEIPDGMKDNLWKNIVCRQIDRAMGKDVNTDISFDAV